MDSSRTATLRATAPRTITPESAEYPELLRQTPDRPNQLFVKGAPLSTHKRCLAVIGTRSMTPYGEFATDLFVRGLVFHGFCIVSGLALGVDGAAHRAALKYAGKTVAILPSGLDAISPREHEPLAAQILAQGGTLLTEYASSMPAFKSAFHQRNRIIAGIAMGVLVIEAGERSGTQITVRFAGDYGRPVFAVPGPITSPFSEGVKKFVNLGAKLVSNVADILEEFSLGGYAEQMSVEQMVAATGSEKTMQDYDLHTLYMCIRATGSIDMETLIARTRFSVERAQVLVGELELKGMIRRLGLHTLCPA